MAKKKNRNIILLKTIQELENELDYVNFEHKKYFQHLCNLIPNKDLEKLDIEIIDTKNFKKRGLVYVFVIEGKIFKIGHTITAISDRVQSYNCGKTEYRIAGTCSTANYFVLQSLLSINKNIEVYTYFPELPKYEIFGIEYQDSFPIPKRAEKEILKEFKAQYKKLPIGCTQK